MSILASNFTSNSLSGTVQVVNQFANVLLQTTPFAFEGDKQFVVKLRRSGTEGLVLLTTPSIVIKDIAEAVSITSNVNVIPEGGSVKFTFVTANAASNSTLYYSTVPLFGTVNAADFFASNTGSFVLNNNQAEIVLTAVEDLSTVEEQGERFALQIRTGSATGNVVYTGGNILIMDTSNVPGVSSLVFASENIYESEAALLTINAYNSYGNSGATFYYTLTGNTDIFSANSGSIVINENIANLEIITESSIPEGESRQLGIQIRKDSITGDIISVSNTVVVNSYITGDITPRISRVSNIISNVITTIANSSIQFNINTAAATNGETLYYTTLSNVNNFIGNTSGSVSVTGNTAIVTITPAYVSSIGNVRLQARRNSINGPILGLSNQVNVEPDFEIFIQGILNSNSIIESEAAEIKLVTMFGGNTRNYYYEILGNANISGSTTGTQKANANIVVISESSVPTGQTRSFYVTVKEDNSSGNVIYTTPNIRVNPYVSGFVNSRVSIVTGVTSNTSTVGKTQAARFTINTLNAANGETLYFATNGTALSSDFTTANTGSVTVNGNTATVTLTVSGSAVVNTGRYFALDIKRGSTSGTLLQSSSNVTFINNDYLGISGGDFVGTSGGYRIIEVMNSQNLTINWLSTTAPRNSIEYTLIAGGGGGGGSDGNGGAGGGGGGGILSGTAPITTIGTLTCSIGGGGSRGTSGTSAAGVGGNTTISGIPTVNFTATGGGRGAGRPGTPGAGSTPGGSGGGGSASSTGAGTGVPGQGFAGAAGSNPRGGGGGGAGAAGSTSTGGVGKAVITYLGNSPNLGGGGGASSHPDGNLGLNGGDGGGGYGGGSIGDANSGSTFMGGGGGGARSAGGVTRQGGAGGSGRLVIRYLFA